MTRSRPSAFHVGITPKTVIDAAAELTRESHLWGWSIRDLAQRLEVSPSVIYHHVGGRDLLARHVVERVVDTLSVPPAHLSWQQWFRAFLLSAYEPISSAPGVAKWLSMHGPIFPSTLDILDLGIASLARAGFGDRTAFAYAALLNSAVLTISIGDERLVHEDDGARDHAAMMADFERAGAGRPGVAVLTASLITPFAHGGTDAAEQRWRYYCMIVDTTIMGLAASLETA